MTLIHQHLHARNTARNAARRGSAAHKSTPGLLKNLPKALASAGTRLLRPSDVAGIVAKRGFAAVMRELVAHIEADFLRWAEFDKTPRVAAHSDVGVIELMPTADAHQYSFKYVNGHPGNEQFQLPTVMAFGVLADVQTGLPTLFSELTLTTALRTAATSVMVAKSLARPDSKRMAIIGNGAQSEFQAMAFAHILGIRQFSLYDVDLAASQKLAQHLQKAGFEATIHASTAEAVDGADIVTTITADKAKATIITPQMLEPGMHINAVGGDCPGKTELHADVLRNASVFVEYEPQTRIEGDIQQLPASFAVTEFWQVLAGLAPGRTRPTEVTVFDSVGFAIEDFSALRYLDGVARELNLGEAIDLLPNNRNPKDLFSLIA